MVATTSPFTIEGYTEADEGEVLDLLHRCLGTGSVDWRDGRVWRWKHMDNPFGRSLALVARGRDGRVIGLRAFMRWEMTSGDTVLRAYRPVDTATDPDMRRSGVFSALTKAALERARSEGVAFTFNTPNDMSFPGYLKMGWREVAPVRPVIKVMDYRRFAVHTALGVLSRRGSSEGPLLKRGRESVWTLVDQREWLSELVHESQSADRYALQVVKSEEYLRWRYLDDPVYEHGAVWFEAPKGTRGCCFFRRAHRSGASGLLIEDVFLSGDRDRAARTLFERVARQLEPDFVMTHFTPGSSLHGVARELGFRALSRRGSHFVVNPLAPTGALDLMSAESWALAMGEIEFF